MNGRYQFGKPTAAGGGGTYFAHVITAGHHLVINAAQAASNAGTWVYSIAYEASTSSSSYSTDKGRTAYQTMQQIASDSTKFYSMPSAGDLSSIFLKIAADLTTTRILDNNTQ